VTLVSIVTPTMPGRETLLLERCMPSVERLAWPAIEHVIVSDPNPLIRQLLAESDGFVDLRWTEINGSWRDGVKDLSIGAVPWHIGSMMALGEYVGFLGDDDELLPDHVARHVEAMEATGADFTISPIDFRVGGQHQRVIGDSFSHGHLDSTGIMCRASALRSANWTANGQDAADHRLVTDWLRAGLRGHLLGGQPTGIHHDGWMAR
jgi:hypothetical protein